MLPNLSATAVVPGSWAYGPRDQPNEEADCDSSCLNVLTSKYVAANTVLVLVARRHITSVGDFRIVRNDSSEIQ